MKETCAMVLSAVMAMSLAGCGGSKAAESTAAATQTQAESSETTAKKETESETSQEAAAEEKTELIVFVFAIVYTITNGKDRFNFGPAARFLN